MPKNKKTSACSQTSTSETYENYQAAKQSNQPESFIYGKDKAAAPAKPLEDKPSGLNSKDEPEISPPHELPEPESEPEEVTQENDLNTKIFSPHTAIKLRTEEAYKLKDNVLDTIKAEILETLLLYPERNQLTYTFATIPEDVMSAVFMELREWSWKPIWDGENSFAINLPQVPFIAPEIKKKHVSVVRPL